MQIAAIASFFAFSETLSSPFPAAIAIKDGFFPKTVCS